MQEDEYITIVAFCSDSRRVSNLFFIPYEVQYIDSIDWCFNEYVWDV